MYKNWEHIIRDLEKWYNHLLFLIPGNDLPQGEGFQAMNLNLALSERLLVLSPKDYDRELKSILLELLPNEGINYVLSGIEILFDTAITWDVIELLKQVSRSRNLLVKWPGQYEGGFLVYATPSHPEFLKITIEDYHVLNG